VARTPALNAHGVPRGAGADPLRVSAPLAMVGQIASSRSMALAMNPEQRRALELLAQSLRGCTEDMMMVAHKFEIDVLAKLIGNGLATATTESVRTGDRIGRRSPIADHGRRPASARG